MRRLSRAFALTCLLSPLAAPVAAGDPSRSLPMQFAIRQEGPAAICRDKCRTWISAVGMVKLETVREFEAFAARNDIRGATIALDSEGGSVVGALALGRAIRRMEMTTTIGKTSELPAGNESVRRATLSPRADCESMCAFILLAGVQRVVPSEARVRVHQIWLGDRRDDANAATYSAEDLVLVQRDIGRLAEYTMEMGGSVALLELSLRIPPWEPMRVLTRDELRRMRLDTAEAPSDRQTQAPASTSSAAVDRAAASSAPAANMSAAAASMRRTSLKSERGWTIMERPGEIMLSRRHPLTVEGETIGSFELTIACGQGPNEYAVTYTDKRKIPDRDNAAIKTVTISMSRKATPLALGPSAFDAARAERDSVASGVLPGAALKAFADSGSHSLTIVTTNASNAATTIRVGNSGAAQSWPRLAASCAQQRTEHAELAPQQ